MATPRKRWFKVADAVLREEWDREQRSTFIGLLAWFNLRWARDGHSGDAAQRGSIPPGDLLTITVSESLDEARAALSRVAPRLELGVEVRGRFTLVHWPKLAEFQEWERPNPGRGSTSAVPSPTPAPAPAPNQNKEEVDSAPRGARPTTSRKPIRTPAPEALNEEQCAKLLAWCREKHPRLVTRLASLIEACLGFHRGKGNVAADWYATVQTWVRNEAEGRFAGARGPVEPVRPQPPAPAAPSSEEQAARDELWRRREIERKKLVAARVGSPGPLGDELRKFGVVK